MNMTDQLAAKPPVFETFGDVKYLKGARGELIPEANVRPALKLQDETVAALFAEACDLHDRLAGFKTKAFADVDAYVALLAERYGAKPRGEKGNMTLFSLDGLIKATVQIADRLAFGPEIQLAKQLIMDELVPELLVGANPKLAAIVSSAFRVDKEGQLNRYAILSLRRIEIDDDRWRAAMKAIEDSERVLSSARFIRFHFRKGWKADGDWMPVSLNFATV